MCTNLTSPLGHAVAAYYYRSICLTICTTAATSMAEAREHERREMQAGAYSYGDAEKK